MLNDPDYARGRQQPGPVAGRGAWITVQNIRRLVLSLDKFLRIAVLDSEAKTTLLGQLDMFGSYAEGLVLRQDRNGPPENQSELGDMEAVLRMAEKNPGHFKSFDVAGLKAKVATLRGESRKK